MADHRSPTTTAPPPLPRPDIDRINAPYWAALRERRLTFQRCVNGHRWLPPRAACPHCLSTDLGWVDAAGTGRLVSWVVYRVAFHEAFRDRLPYNVAIVELDEGPRMITNIRAPHDALAADARVRVVFDIEGGGGGGGGGDDDLSFTLARFELAP